MADKSTKGVRDLIKDLEGMELQSIEQVKNKSKDWEKYFELYKSSYKIFNNKKDNYVKALDKFDSFFNAIESFGDNNVNIYVKRLGSTFNQTKKILEDCKTSVKTCDDNIDDLIKNIQKYISEECDKKGLKSIHLFAGKKSWKDLKERSIMSVKVSDDLYKCKMKEFNHQKKEILKKIDSTIDKNSKLKAEISEKLNILNFSSMERNVFQMKPTSPLRILKELHEALINENKDFPTYKNKSLLAMNKKLDGKIERSMEKVITCKWENPYELKKQADFFDNIEDNLDGFDKNAKVMTEGLKNFAVNFKNAKSIDNLINLSTEVKMNARKLELKKGTNTAAELFRRTISYREQSKILLICIISVEKSLTNLKESKIEDIVEYFYYENQKASKRKIFAIIWEAFNTAISLLPLIGATIAKISEKVKNLVDTTANIVNQAKTDIEVLKEGIHKEE